MRRSTGRAIAFATLILTLVASLLVAPASAIGEDGKYGTGKDDGAKFQDIDEDRSYVARNVRNIGNQAVYCRNNLWVCTNALDIDPEKDKDKIKKIKRFSKEWFALTRGNTKEENIILASQRPHEEMLIKLRGVAYRIAN